MIFVVAGITVFVIIVAGILGGLGVLGGTEVASNGHDHWMSRLVDWMF